MRLEFSTGAAQVHCFSDLVITTNNNELLYAAFGGYDTSVQAMKAACHSKKSESFYLYPTDDCPPNMFGARGWVWIQVIGSFKAHLGKMHDLTQAEVVSSFCYEGVANPVILAWDGNLLKAFGQRIMNSHPFPLMDEWMEYILGECRDRGLVEDCKVYTTSEPQLKAIWLKATAEEIEQIVKDRFYNRILTIPDGDEGDQNVRTCHDVTGYLTAYGRALAKSLGRLYVPRHMPGDELDPKLHQLLRKPFKAQADTAQGLAKTLKVKRSAICVGEMGSGKTFLGLAVAHLIGAKEIAVLCPGHLTKKWKREAEETVPGAEGIIVSSFRDVFKIRDLIREGTDHPRFYIFPRDTAKLGYFKRRAVRWSERRGGWICPDCGEVQMNPRTDAPFTFEDFEEDTARTGKCGCYKEETDKHRKCGTRLWTADNQLAKKVAPADLVKKYMRGKCRFDLFLADELHQFKGDSAQGTAFGSFVQASKKTLGLTGTLLGGFASNLYRILFRLRPEVFLTKGMDFHSSSRFAQEYGVVERVYKSDESSVKNRSSKGNKKQVSLNERPGVSPKVFGEFLLDMCAFLELGDVTNMLPSYTEVVELVEMDEDLSDAYQAMAGTLKKVMLDYSRFGSNAMLGVYLNNLLSYPDRPFGNGPITKPKSDEVLFIPEELDENVLYSKEERLIELVKARKRQGRKCLIYATFTGKKRDVSKRLQEILFKEGIKVAVLKSSVPLEKREEWLADKVYRGYDVVITNPVNVETGLDCLDFPTIIFYETGYNLYTLRQASRRHYRIGQKHPCEVIFMAYEGTLQEAAIRLMGAKLEASLAIEGRFSEEGLRAMGSGVGANLGTELAKALVEGLDGIDSAEAIWGRMGYGTIESDVSGTELQVGAEPAAVPESLFSPAVQQATVNTPGGSGLVKIVEITRVGSKRKAKETASKQLGWDFGQGA